MRIYFLCCLFFSIQIQAQTPSVKLFTFDSPNEYEDIWTINSRSGTEFNQDDMNKLVTVFCSDEKVDKNEVGTLRALQQKITPIYILCNADKKQFRIMKMVNENGMKVLDNFFSRAKLRTPREATANLLYFHLPEKFFDFYLSHDDTAHAIDSSLYDYVSYLANVSDKQDWLFFRNEVKFLYSATQTGNNFMDERHRKLILNACTRVVTENNLPIKKMHYEYGRY